MAIGKAYEAHFKPAADGARKEGNAKGGKSTANRQQTSERSPTTAKKAAEAVGMSERQVRKFLTCFQLPETGSFGISEPATCEFDRSIQLPKIGG